MKSSEELREPAMQSSAKLQQSQHELLTLYHQLAEDEGIELTLKGDGFPMVEFRVCLSSAVVLLLINARKRFSAPSKDKLCLSDVMERLILESSCG